MYIVNIFSSVIKIVLTSQDKYVSIAIFSGSVLHGSLLHSVVKHGDFSNTDVSQGSVATRLRCRGIFNIQITTNLLLSLPTKEF